VRVECFRVEHPSIGLEICIEIMSSKDPYKKAVTESLSESKFKFI